MEITRPTELVDLFAYIEVCAPNFPGEDACTNADVFSWAFNALELFLQHAKTEEGKEKLRECERNLRVAYEFFEKGDEVSGSKFVQETEQMFQKAKSTSHCRMRSPAGKDS